MDPRLQGALERWDLADPRPLPGGGRIRQYYRVQHPQLGTAVVALHPRDESEQSQKNYFEFRALQAYLDPLLRVPTILQCADDDRCLLLEDLGDTLLEHRLMAHPEEELAWATQAGYLLATLAGPLTLGAPGHTFFMQRAFDQAEFSREWEQCRAHFFQDFLQKDPPRWLDRMMEEVHGSLETRAQFFAHREFQVRNLMVHGDRLVVIDFQDARRGAATYDLASLLYDAYWEWSKEARRALIAPLEHELGWNHEALLDELNLSALQRNFRALGTFGHQLVHLRKAQVAAAVPRTLRHLKGHFQRMHHQDGVLAIEHLLRLTEERLLKG